MPWGAVLASDSEEEEVCQSQEAPTTRDKSRSPRRRSASPDKPFNPVMGPVRPGLETWVPAFFALLRPMLVMCGPQKHKWRLEVMCAGVLPEIVILLATCLCRQDDHTCTNAIFCGR